MCNPGQNKQNAVLASLVVNAYNPCSRTWQNPLQCAASIPTQLALTVSTMVLHPATCLTINASMSAACARWGPTPWLVIDLSWTMVTFQLLDVPLLVSMSMHGCRKEINKPSVVSLMSYLLYTVHLTDRKSVV